MNVIVARAVELNNAVHEAAVVAAQKNARVYYHVHVGSYDAEKKDVHHGSEMISLSFSFKLAEAGSQTQYFCSHPSVDEHFKKRRGTVFFVSMILELNSTSSHGERASFSFAAPLGQPNDTEKWLVNRSDPSKNWRVELGFGSDSVMTSITLHHVPEDMPYYVEKLMREAVYIEEERLVTLLHSNVVLETQKTSVGDDEVPCVNVRPKRVRTK